tara:strand:+ start:1849 stop:2553 length:705 start_codon:yes stop_codon:yes gene_type:complete
MTEDLELQTYVKISPFQVGIYLYDTKNSKNLYEHELKYENIKEIVDLNVLNQLLDQNVFRIEKLLGNFVENICLVVEDINHYNISFGIKKKIYENIINKKYLENLLIEAKDLFNENYQTEKIMHIIIDKYLVDDLSYLSFDDNFVGENFSLEIQFKSISSSLANDIEKVLEKYHIRISNYVDGNYVKDFFLEENTEFGEMLFKIINGFNINEVKLVPKNLRKIGFFEKFFQLFS